MTEEREKNQLLAIAKDVVWNENEPITGRLSGVRILIEDCCLTIQKKQAGLDRLYVVEKRLVSQMLVEYKEKRIADFMEKFGSGEITPELIAEMKKIDKPAHCYSVEGITIIEKDCNLCNRRSCERSGATLEYQLEENEKPMDGLE